MANFNLRSPTHLNPPSPEEKNIENKYKKILGDTYVPPGYSYEETYFIYKDEGRFVGLIVDGEEIFIPVFPFENIHALLTEVSKHIETGNVYVNIPGVGNSIFLGVIKRNSPNSMPIIYVSEKAPRNATALIPITENSYYRNPVTIYGNAVSIYVR